MREAGKMNAAQSHQPRRSILIVLIAGIGALVLASPSIRALRNGYPDAELHLLTSAEAAPLARHYPYRELSFKDVKEAGMRVIPVWKRLRQYISFAMHNNMIYRALQMK